MELHLQPDGLHRAVPVFFPLEKARMWVEQADLEQASPRGIRITRNRRGYPVRAEVVQVGEAVIASHIGSHTKGEAYRDLAIGGNLWSLTGTPGARR